MWKETIFSRSCFASFPMCVYKFSSHYLINIIFIANSLGHLARESPCTKVHKQSGFYKNLSPNPTNASVFDPLNERPSYIKYIQQHCIHKVPISLRDNLQRECDKLHGLPTSSRDSSCYVSRPILAPPPLWPRNMPCWPTRTPLRALSLLVTLA
jgi:hypothetical protein